MTKSIFALLLLSQSLYAIASEQSTCTANKGAYITGTVVSAPRFASASTTIEGVKLTHTRLNVRADQDGKTYDVAIGNVYAVDHVKNASTMPPSLAAIKVNERLGLCGKKYTSGTGIHWVHSNCGATPTTAEPNGWVKVIASSSSVSASKTRSQNYCYLWD